jgi:hypothetical protein
MLTATLNRRPWKRMTEKYKETPNNWQMMFLNMKQIVTLSETQMMLGCRKPTQI